MPMCLFVDQLVYLSGTRFDCVSPPWFFVYIRLYFSGVSVDVSLAVSLSLCCFCPTFACVGKNCWVQFSCEINILALTVKC